MSDFMFDKSISPEEKIGLFFDHLQQIDAEMAAILETCIYNLLPLPPSSLQRNSLRQQTNAIIEQTLDSMIKQ